MPVSSHSAAPPPARWHRALSLWAPPALYALAIFGSSSLPAAPTPSYLTDKHMHLLAYAGFAAVLVRALAGGHWLAVTRGTGIQAALVAIVYGAADEWHQSFVPSRQADLLDVAADAAGAILAVAVLAFLSRRGERANGTIERAAGRVGQTP